MRTSRYRGRFVPKSRYQYVSDREREQLIDLVVSKALTIKVSAEICRIPYENAKAIVRVYRQEGRTKRLFDFVPASSEGAHEPD